MGEAVCTPVCGSGGEAGPLIGRLVVLKPELTEGTSDKVLV